MSRGRHELRARKGKGCKTCKRGGQLHTPVPVKAAAPPRHRCAKRQHDNRLPALQPVQQLPQGAVLPPTYANRSLQVLYAPQPLLCAALYGHISVVPLAHVRREQAPRFKLLPPPVRDLAGQAVCLVLPRRRDPGDYVAAAMLQ